MTHADNSLVRAHERLFDQVAETVDEAVREVAALALPASASAMKIFTDIDEAEAWLARPLDQIP